MQEDEESPAHEKQLFSTELTGVRNAVSSTRIKFTALAVSKTYLVCGANTGSLYIFSRSNENEMLRLISNAEISESIHLLRFCPHDEDLLAVATVKHIIYIIRLNLADRNTKEKIQYKINDHKSTIHDMVWGKDAHAFRVFSGDEQGEVFSTDLKNFIQKTTSLIETMFPIVQLQYADSQLLISNTVQVFLINFDKSSCIKIGTKPRDGEFGCCFHPDGSNWILASRPGKNIWQADSSGKVKATMVLKNSFAEPNTLITSHFPLAGQKVKLSTIQLRKLEQFGEYVLSWDQGTLILINPANKDHLVSEWHADVHIRQLVFIDQYIYLLNERENENPAVFELQILQFSVFSRVVIQRAINTTFKKLESSSTEYEQVYMFCVQLAIKAKLNDKYDYPYLKQILELAPEAFDFAQTGLAEFLTLVEEAKTRYEIHERERLEAKEREKQRELELEQELLKREEEAAKAKQKEIKEREEALLAEMIKFKELEERLKYEEKQRIKEEMEAEKRRQELEQKLKEDARRDRERKDQALLNRIANREKKFKEALNLSDATTNDDPLNPPLPPPPSKSHADASALDATQPDDEDLEAQVNLQYTEDASVVSDVASSIRVKSTRTKSKKRKKKKSRIAEILPPITKQLVPPGTVAAGATGTTPFAPNAVAGGPVNASTPHLAIPGNKVPAATTTTTTGGGSGLSASPSFGDIANAVTGKERSKLDWSKLIGFSWNLPEVLTTPQVPPPTPQTTTSTDSVIERVSDVSGGDSNNNNNNNGGVLVNDMFSDLVPSMELYHEDTRALYESLPQSKAIKQVMEVSLQMQPTLAFTEEQRTALYEWICTFDLQKPFHAPYEWLQTLITFCFEQEIDGVHHDMDYAADDDLDEFISIRPTHRALHKLSRSTVLRDSTGSVDSTTETPVRDEHLEGERAVLLDSPCWTDEERLAFVKKYYYYLYLQRVFYICNQLAPGTTTLTLDFLLHKQQQPVPEATKLASSSSSSSSSTTNNNKKKDKKNSSQSVPVAAEARKTLTQRRVAINSINHWMDTSNARYSEAISLLLTKHDTGLCLLYLHPLLCCPATDEVVSFLNKAYPLVLPRNVYMFLNTEEFLRKSKLEIYRARKAFINAMKDLVNRYPALRQDTELIYQWMAQCMKHEAPEVSWLYSKTPEGELVPKVNTHALQWGHSNIIMSLIQQSHIYSYNRADVLRLCKEHGFFSGLIYLYTFVQDYTPAIDLVLYIDDVVSFQRMCGAFNSQNWVHVLSKWPRVGTKRRMITPEIVVSALLNSQGSLESIHLLSRAKEFANNIPLYVYKDLLHVGKIAIQQDILLPKVLERINAHLWSQRPKEIAPQSQYFIEYELTHGNLPVGEFDNTLPLPWFYEEHQNHWGVPAKLVCGSCPVCTLPIKETRNAIVVFRCGHVYHQSCNLDNACRECFSMESLLNW